MTACDFGDEIKHFGIITLLSDYYGMDEDAFADYCDSRNQAQVKKDALIEERLALQAAVFVLRRCRGIPGEVIDSLYDVNRKKREELEQYYGSYHDPNETVDF